jgi:hypothetical protein
MRIAAWRSRQMLNRYGAATAGELRLGVPWTT